MTRRLHPNPPRRQFDDSIRRQLRADRIRCLVRREGDEMACACGARWPHGEDHP